MIERILVVQTAFLGDVVLTTPLLRALKARFAGAHVTVVATPLGAATLAGLPFVETLIAYDKKGKDRGLGGTWELARRLRGAQFDLAIAAQRSSRTGLLVRLSGARRRIGFEGASGAWACNERVLWDPRRHAVHRYLALGTPVGIDLRTADATPVLSVLPEARTRVESLLRGEGIASGTALLSIAPGSVWGTKRWTPEGYAAVVRAAPGLGLVPVLVGSPDERALCEEVARLAGSAVPVLAGRTGLADLAALLALSRAVVTNDSGPGHVASAVGTAVVAVFGPTVPAFGYTPFGARNRIVENNGLDCRPCDRHGPQVCPLGHHRCMKEIGAGEVLAALRETLKG